jgi:hypothetical protein
MGVAVRTQKTLAIFGGTVAALAALAFGLSIPGGAAGDYTPTSIAGSPDVAPGTAVVQNANGTTSIATLAQTSASSVSIASGSLTLNLTGVYTTSVVYSPTDSTVTLSNGATVNLSGLGLEPGSVIEITLYSTGTVVGKAIVAANGSYAIAVVIPPGISQGAHTLAETATAKNGKPVKLSLGVKIAAPKSVTVGPFITGTQLNPILDAQVNQLALVVKSQHKKSVLLTGYTDSTGTKAANLTQSKERAASVATQLAVDLKTLKVTGVKISSKGDGEANPLTNNKTTAGQIKNRRVVATLS